MRICGAELRRLVERDRVGHGRADPERAFVEVRHELGADERDQEQRRGEDERRRRPASPRGSAGRRRAAARTRRARARRAGRFGSLTCLRRKYAHSTGSSVSEQSSEPTSANDIVSAIGRNSRPDGPGQHVDRQVPGDDHRDGVEDGALDVARRRRGSRRSGRISCRAARPARGRCSPP